MKLTDNELNELKYHYVDRMVDNMSTKDLVNLPNIRTTKVCSDILF